jgi:hypothetical protein
LLPHNFMLKASQIQIFRILEVCTHKKFADIKIELQINIIRIINFSLKQISDSKIQKIWIRAPF